MSKTLLTSVVIFVLAFSFSTPVCSQEAPVPPPKNAKKQKTAQQARWEGMVVRTSPEKQTLIVRKVGSTMEKTIYYDSSTQFVSQKHGSKKVNSIDASDIKDNDRVICRGHYDDKGEFRATLISKRLTPL